MWRQRARAKQATKRQIEDSNLKEVAA